LSEHQTPLDLVRLRPVDGPVACARPDRLAVASRWFQAHFPGEVLYAVKANPSPWVIDTLYAAGHRWFDVASLPEVELIASRCPEATMAFMTRRALAIHESFGITSGNDVGIAWGELASILSLQGRTEESLAAS